MKHLLCIVAIFCLTMTAFADWHALGNVTAVAPLPNGVELSAGQARVRITALDSSTVRVRVAADGAFPKDSSWALDPAYLPSDPQVHVTQTPDAITLDLPALNHVRITKSPLRIAFLDAQNNLLSEDDAREPMAFNGPEFRVTKSSPPNDSELYFGLGDKTSLILNNRAFTLWNTDAFGWQESTDPLYKAIPFFIALRNGRAYGIFMDNAWRSSFDFGKGRHDAISFGAEGGQLNYYFFFGPSPKQVLTAYTNLTGKTPLPPLWSLGYQQCRYSYYPESRVREIARTFRDKKIPADVIYLDIDYQDQYRPFTINRAYFPHFESMIKDLRSEGFSTIVITDLHVAKADYPPYNSGSAQDVFMKNPDGSQYVGTVWPGPSVFPDFTLTRAREWWGSLYKDFVAMGVRGFWNDMNEPSVFDVPGKTMPLDIPSRLDNGTTIPHLAAHNVIGMENSRATYEGLLKLESPANERPFVLTRATYAGGQRFAATWTGDNSATWNHLRMSIPTLLNLGISGEPLVGDDIGGFNGTGTADLVTRWMWLGAFNPIFRNHSAKGTGDKEPWAFGPPYESYMKAAIEQRYRMLLYIYSAADEAARTGIPIMRPLFLEFSRPEDQWLANNQDEFMFGPAMLVAPKVWEYNEPYDIHLPAGEWFDYWTGEKYRGGETGTLSETSSTGGVSLKVNPRVNELPVFVKSGSIIAQQPVVQSTAYTPQGNLELRVYPGPDCHAVLYMDNGHSLQTGTNRIHLPMSCTQDASGASLTLAPQQGEFKPWFSSLDIVFYGAPSTPRSASLDGHSAAQPEYDAAHHTASLTVHYKAAGEKISIIY
ncbi:MAG: glycoside hydrolase family 31 protein [Acidobacteriaceae bacterium]